jgi:hypothetical protein
MLGSVVSRNGGTPAIESPGNAEAWLRTRPSAALALAKPARDGIHLWCVELDATRPQSAEDMRLILFADERTQTDGLHSERIHFSVSLSGNLSLLAFALPPDFETGRLPAFRHALDTITWDGLCA